MSSENNINEDCKDTCKVDCKDTSDCKKSNTADESSVESPPSLNSSDNSNCNAAKTTKTAKTAKKSSDSSENESGTDYTDDSDDGSDESSEMTIEQSLELIQGVLTILAIRMKSNTELLAIHTALLNYFNNGRLTEMLAFSRVLQCHYEKTEPTLCDAFSQLTDLLDPIVVDLDLKERSDYLSNSLKGVLSYFKFCFRDNKIPYSQETNDILYDSFINALQQNKYYMMYGMLLTCQELFQQPEKSVVFDIIHEHIVSLCPNLDE